MSRSPLFYPMHRGETDAGGAADLQTDIMRFMAILALCLVAIFALVQSIPLVPEPLTQSPAAAAPPPLAVRAPEAFREPPQRMPEKPTPPQDHASARHIVLKRPVPAARPPEVAVEEEETAPVPAPPATAQEGFSLRFESDLALTRLVAAGQVGVYALDGGRARRMTVSDSRISFWDASSPNSFHEMEASTVPGPVVDALARTGADTSAVDWGVTLPGKLRSQLDSLLREHSGGELVIAGDGSLRLEAS